MLVSSNGILLVYLFGKRESALPCGIKWPLTTETRTCVPPKTERYGITVDCVFEWNGIDQWLACMVRAR